MRVAVVGSDLAAGFAAAAARDSGAEVHVYAEGPRPSLPPSGAVYLRSLPAPLEERFQSVHHVETVWGLDLSLYSLRKWGEFVPTNINAVFDYMVRTLQPAMERDIWPVTPELASALFDGVRWHEGAVDASLVRELSGDGLDLVAVTAPIPFTSAAPRMGYTLLLPFADKLDQGLLQASQLDAAFHLLAWSVEHYQVSSLTIYNAHVGPAWLKAQSVDGAISLELPSVMLSPAYWREQGVKEETSRQLAGWLDAKTVRLPRLHPNNRTCNKSPALDVLLCGEAASWCRDVPPQDIYGQVSQHLRGLAQVKDLLG